MPRDEFEQKIMEAYFAAKDCGFDGTAAALLDLLNSTLRNYTGIEEAFDDVTQPPMLLKQAPIH